MGGEEGNQIPPDDRQPDPVDALKSEIESLRKSIDKVRDSQQQIDESQNKLVKSIVSASRVAQETADDLAKTKTEFLSALQGIQGKAITPDMIKEGMKGFADEIAKATDAKLTAFMDSFAQQPVTNQQGGQMVRQGGGSVGDLLTIILQNADGISKLMSAFKPAAPPVAPLAEQLTSYLRLQKVIGDLTNANVDIDKFHEEATKALKPAVSNQPPA